MFRKLLPLAVVLSGCPENGTMMMGEDSGTMPPQFAASSKGNVRFKRATRLTNDFAAALNLPDTDLCKELGQYACTSFVHPISLGAADPYGIGLYEPLPFTGLATPLVTERVALNACINRVTADLATPAGADIFKNLPLDAMGKLDISSQAATDAVDLLYQRAVVRHPTAAEIAHFKKLYDDIVASGKPDPGKSWMQLSCFAVLTSVEALFY